MKIIKQLTTDGGKEYYKSTPTHADSIYPAEFPGFDMEKAVKQWNNSDLLRTCLLKFAKDYAQIGNEIITCVSQGKNKKAADLAHKLKGGAGALALHKIVAAAADFELKLPYQEAALAAAAQLQEAIDEAGAGIAVWVAQNGAEAKTQAVMIPEHATERLNTARELLNALDSDSPAIIEPVLEKSRTGLPGGLCADIEEKLADFDFRGAEILLHDYLKRQA
ncbi:MAG: Hpt domain-containing protein [Methylomonas sp.]|jgi:HPt (histidine-containing phosphotransfer) domain-containing protein